MVDSGTDTRKRVLTFMILADIRKGIVNDKAAIEMLILKINAAILVFQSGRLKLGIREQSFRNLCHRADTACKDKDSDLSDILIRLKRIAREMGNLLANYNKVVRRQEVVRKIVVVRGYLVDEKIVNDLLNV